MTSLRLVVAVACAVAGVGAGAAAGADSQVREVVMPGRAFAPASLDALVGETVVWRNADAVSHTVTSDGEAFSSGFVPPGGTFSFTFARQGVYRYHCTIHRFMRGVVRVAAIALRGPEDPVLTGHPAALVGIARAGTRSVALRQRRDGRWKVVRTLVPATDGSFAASVPVVEPSVFSATAGAAVSVPVHVAVAPRVTARVRGRELAAVSSPTRSGARAALQVYDRYLFGWRTVARGRVESTGAVSFRLDPGLAGLLRVVVRGGGGWADGASAGIRVG